MTATRHWFVLTPVVVPSSCASLLAKAAAFEAEGNWYLAGETYVSLEKLPDVGSSPMTKAQLRARAASCFELAHDSRVSARLYDDASREVAALAANPHLAAELSNRAALQFRDASEFFFAGSSWTRAAEEFGKIPTAVINCTENFEPFPMSSFKSHLRGVCFEAAAAAFEKATGNEMWGVGAYWRAGKSYSEGIPNIQAFVAYRRSLRAHIRYYGTLEFEQLRLSLPLSTEERASEINPIEVMEAALARCNNHHQQEPGDTPKSRLQTHRQMAAAFHEFALTFQDIGNTKEVERFRAAQNERQRRIHLLQRNYFAAALYRLWQLTSGYGESLGRWELRV